MSRPSRNPATKQSAAPAPKEKQKPGNKGDFQGQHLEFLNSRMPDYLETSKKGKTRTLWPNLLRDYWEKFDWRLAMNQDPAPTDLFPPESTLGVEAAATKSKVMQETKQVGVNFAKWGFG
jgi:hypothetical protein